MLRGAEYVPGEWALRSLRGVIDPEAHSPSRYPAGPPLPSWRPGSRGGWVGQMRVSSFFATIDPGAHSPGRSQAGGDLRYLRRNPGPRVRRARQPARDGWSGQSRCASKRSDLKRHVQERNLKRCMSVLASPTRFPSERASKAAARRVRLEQEGTRGPNPRLRGLFGAGSLRRKLDQAASPPYRASSEERRGRPAPL